MPFADFPNDATERGGYAGLQAKVPLRRDLTFSRSTNLRMTNHDIGVTTISRRYLILLIAIVSL